MMSDRPVLVPNRDHPIDIRPSGGRVVVTLGGRIVADSRSALELKEASYPPVYYVPRQDVDMSLLERSEHTTYCPFKGDASYYGIPVGGLRSVNAVWSYESPFEAMAAIKDHLAFYPDRVDAIACLD